MKKILFIGNFLSAHRGTVGPVEGVMSRLKNEYNIISASTYNHTLLKFFDFIFKATFGSYEVIHIDTYSTNAIYFAYITSFIGKVRDKKVILNLHGGGLFRLYETGKNKKKLITKLFSFATVVVTPSLYLKDKFEKEGFFVEYLPNAVDFEKFPYSADDVNNHKLLWVRAFKQTYRPWLAVKTLYEVRKKYPDATLTMAGPDKGSLLNETKKLITNLQLDEYVNIVGKIQNDKLTEYYTSHQVFLNTTDTESFGVAVMEAASSGIPIVTTSVGELPYLWQHEVNAMLIGSFDEKAFAQAISLLFDNNSMRESIRNNARQKAESFAWEVIKNKWKEILA